MKDSIIIIGSGVAGLYASYKLHKKYKNIKITFYEKSDRVGGRLMSRSIRLDDNKKTIIENGGMRVLVGQQPHIEKLIKELNVKLIDPPPSNKNNFDYYRGKKGIYRGYN